MAIGKRQALQTVRTYQLLTLSLHLVALEMFHFLLLYILCLTPLDTTSSTDPDGQQLLPVSSATANKFHEDHPPELAIDGDQNTYYHSGGIVEQPPQWLKLQLEEPALVSRIVIISRLSSTHAVVIYRLIGTHGYLYYGTTQIADCGKITQVNADYPHDVASQTYTLPCDSLQFASYVKLEDSEKAGDEEWLAMNIAEVTVYGTTWKAFLSKGRSKSPWKPGTLGQISDMTSPLVI
eukprot:sb/3469251/